MNANASCEVYRAFISDDREHLAVWIEMPDGSLRAAQWLIEDVIARSGEIDAATHSPRHAVQQ